MSRSSEKVKTRIEILYIRETLRDSILSDLGTLGLGLAFMGVGAWWGSNAMGWVGAISLFITMLSIGSGKHRYTIAEARTKLDELEKELANG